ncbi:MAG: glycosyltransferase [Cyclobacteriaceae bacterium]|nr:glycosyltransferase [Cyclobacteriaceae bacterium]
MSKVKICFIVTTLEPGGIENYLLRLLQYSINKVEPTVLCKGGRAGKLLNSYLKIGVSVKVIKAGYFNLFRWAQLFHFLRQNEFDSICDFTGNFGGIPMLLSRLAKIEKRVTYYPHSSHRFKVTLAKRVYVKIVNKLVFLHSTHIVANSKLALKVFFPYLKSDSQTLKVIYNGIDVELFSKDYNKKSIREELGIPIGDFVVGHTGRFNEAKNHSTIFKVAQRLQSIYKNITFVFCGVGTDSKSFKEQLEFFKVHKISKTLGYRSDVSKILNSFDVFYFPSITEGQPNSLLEALVVGLPIVSSNIETIRESVPDYLTPFLLEPYDVESAVCKISKLHSNEITIFREASDWAKQAYNPKIRFEELLDIL